MDVCFSNDSLTCHPFGPSSKTASCPCHFRRNVSMPDVGTTPKAKSQTSFSLASISSLVVKRGSRFPRLSFSFETHGDKEIFSGVAGRKSTAFELSSSISNTYLLIGVDGRVSHSLAVRSLVLSSSRCTSPSLSQTVPLASRSTYHVSTSHSMLSPCFCQTLSSNSLPLDQRPDTVPLHDSTASVSSLSPEPRLETEADCSRGCLPR